MSNQRTARICIRWVAGLLCVVAFVNSGDAAEPPVRVAPVKPADVQSANAPPDVARSKGVMGAEGASNAKSANGGKNATGARSTTSAEAIGVRTYIGEAKILGLTPASLQPAGQFMVDVALTLKAPVSEAQLMSSLRVFVDAVEVSRANIDSGDPRPSAIGAGSDIGAVVDSSAAPTLGGVVSSQFTVSLFALAPKNLDPYQPHTVSVYSQLDRRSVATFAALALAPPPMRPSTLFTTLISGQSIESQYFLLYLGVLPIAVGGVYVWWRQRRRATKAIEEEKSLNARREEDLRLRAELRQFDMPRGGGGVVEGSDVILPAARPAVLPQRLFDQASAGSLSLVIGPGVSAQSGLPTSVALYRAVLKECRAALSESQGSSLAKLLRDEGPDAMVEALVALLGRERVIASLRSFLVRPNSSVSRLHGELARLPIRACIDTTWDDLSLAAFKIDAKDVYGPNRKAGFSTGYRSGMRQLIKPYGSVGDPSTMVLTEHEYRRQVAGLPELQRSIAALFSTQSLLFVGMSLRGIGEFLSGLPPELEGGSYVHYALVPADGNSELWQAGLGKKFGIEIIEFSPSADFREVPDAIATLNASVRTGTPEEIAQLSQTSAKLRYVQLKSIGIFRELNVELAPGWTLLLGNNGGGKSTILRSIALALSGNDARLSALSGRLLRSGENTGSIEIGVGTSRIVSGLVRDEKAVTVRSPQTTLLQSGQMLVLAFPALRGVVTTAPQGPTAGGPVNPSVDDVLPLIQGMVDSRLNNLQQWLVNAVLRAEKNSKGRDAQMLVTFQSLIAEMVPGGHIKYSRLDRTAWTVYFSIDGVEVPFDGISQGMSSILNWVGVLLQRLYDVYPNSQVPEKEAALVLIDEIDAHLHPIWQRQLVSLARKKFPNVQVVASSHSPFLAGAVSREELRIVERDAETLQIRAAIPKQDLAGQKVEDILTSSLFSLPTTRSPDAEQEIGRYFELFEKPAESLSGQEREELAKLGQRLRGLNYGPTLKQEEVNEDIKATIDAQLKTLSPEAIAAMQDMMSGGGQGTRGTDPGASS